MEVNYKKNKTAIFHKNFMEMEGREIYYDDIEAVRYSLDDMGGLAWFLPVARWVDGRVHLFVKNEKKPVTVSLMGIHFLGIPIVPTPQRAMDGFERLYEAIDSIVTPKIAQRYLEQIHAGQEVELAGLLINRWSAVNKKRDKVISKENYGGLQRRFNHVTVLDKYSDPLWQTSIKDVFSNNVTALPHVLEELFSTTSPN